VERAALLCSTCAPRLRVGGRRGSNSIPGLARYSRRRASRRTARAGERRAPSARAKRRAAASSGGCLERAPGEGSSHTHSLAEEVSLARVPEQQSPSKDNAKAIWMRFDKMRRAREGSNRKSRPKHTPHAEMRLSSGNEPAILLIDNTNCHSFRYGCALRFFFLSSSTPQLIIFSFPDRTLRGVKREG
jgi:hypothetical protein